MKAMRYVYVAAVVAALLVALGLWNPLPKEAKANRGPSAPEFKVDPSWPKPLPNKCPGSPWIRTTTSGSCSARGL
jgi:hypothetical protein